MNSSPKHIISLVYSLTCAVTHTPSNRPSARTGTPPRMPRLETTIDICAPPHIVREIVRISSENMFLPSPNLTPPTLAEGSLSFTATRLSKSAHLAYWVYPAHPSPHARQDWIGGQRGGYPPIRDPWPTVDASCDRMLLLLVKRVQPTPSCACFCSSPISFTLFKSRDDRADPTAPISFSPFCTHMSHPYLSPSCIHMSRPYLSPSFSPNLAEERAVRRPVVRPLVLPHRRGAYL